MIYTVTFNPSIDYIVKIDNLRLGTVNRTQNEEIYPGGKGINVSIMLKKLGVESKVLGFIGGFTGDEIEARLKSQGCYSEFIKVADGLSRINVKISSKEESEINSRGPRIKGSDVEKLYSQLKDLKSGDILVLAGSIPNTLPENIYEDICDFLSNNNINIVVDATRNLLVNVLKYKPFLIKPNKYELEEIFNTKLNDEEEIIEKGKKLQKCGARNVLISMAGEGAILVSENGEIFKSKPPKGVVINSVGAGDSMVAGFLAGYLKRRSMEEAFKMGVAAGSVSAFSPWMGDKAQVLRLYDEI